MTDSEHVNPYPGQRIRKVDFVNGSYSEHPEPVSDIEDANLVTSEVATELPLTSFASAVEWANWHKPVLDIDFGAKLIPSTTDGHYHLFLDKLMTWEQYERLLLALADAGILEPGYVSASRDRGYTAVRLPWIKKGNRGADHVGEADPMSIENPDFAAELHAIAKQHAAQIPEETRENGTEQ